MRFSLSTDQKLMLGIGIFSLVLLFGGYWVTSKQDAALNKPLMGQKVSSMGEEHVKRNQKHAAYNSNPPTSGPHWGDGVAGAGEHTTEVPDELLVHSLEHGAVIVSYKADLPKNQVEKIRNAYNDASGKKIFVPRKNLDVPVALTSWEYLMKLKAIDPSKIKLFIETNSGKGPESAPI